MNKKNKIFSCEYFSAINDISSVVFFKTLGLKVWRETNYSFFVKCPFHNEETASLSFFKNFQRWHCFGCGDGGDYFDFVQRCYRWNKTRTAYWFYKNFGIPLPWKK